jgi:ABC-type multidrug transport system fused ATPase/permease subunit
MDSPSSVEGDFMKSTQVFAASLSSVLCTFTTAIGIELFLAPSFIVDNVFGCLEGDSITELEVLLARTIGGLMLALSLLSFLLLLPFWTRRQNSSIHACSVDKCRTSLSSQAIVGLSFVMVGLWDHRLKGDDAHCGAAQYQGLLGSGASFVVLACIGLMTSFWPSRPDESEEEGNEASRTLCCRRRHAPSVNNDLVEPLLGQLADMEDDAESHGPERGSDTESQGEAAAGITSRIRGTKRLIKLAAPQVFYLYLGCAVLLVRLPFSLSIPHFVSTTLGALARGDYESARMEILLLFILGTIDAALDFWCVFLFGYAKERIVRGVRVDTLASILRQEVTFFDRHTSGELSSRLSSDCGEMAGGTLITTNIFSTAALVVFTCVCLLILRNRLDLVLSLQH